MSNIMLSSNAPPVRANAALAKRRRGELKLLRAKYNTFNFLARAFEGPFWYFAQKRSRVADQFAAHASRSVLIESKVAQFMWRKRNAARRAQ
jgi:hypothetical protein